MSAPPRDTEGAHEAYELIDRFLRNNLDDTDYAKYSEALDSVLFSAPAMAEALDFLSGLHPGLTIDGPPMEVAKRIFDAVLADRSALTEKVKNMERNLDFMRARFAKATGSRS